MIPRLVLLAASMSWGAPAASAPNVGPRDWLRHIVTDCLDPKSPEYCSRCARPVDGACGGKTACAESTSVWGKAPGMVAIRDRKMCGCPSGFVHGLVMPQAAVSGVEDPGRPKAIWGFAWKQAVQRIPAEDEIVLTVNPPQRRTQDHLHIHITRFAPGGRAKLMRLSPELVASPDYVWGAAEAYARREGFEGWYGVAVAKSGHGWVVVAVPGGAEHEFAAARCD